ncbi:MAG TPA: hypothetical protein DEV87_06700 [Clostridiales bacterium]|nr:hypothetical protein [Clostridiales bacterium]
MVKKAQREFILLTTAILFAVFAVIFCASYFVLKVDFNRTVSSDIDDAFFTYDRTEGAIVKDDSFVAKLLSSEPRADGTYWIDARFDANALNEDFINRVVAFAEEKNYDFGNYGEVYYKLIRSGDKTLVAGVIATELYATLRANLLTVFLILAIIYVVLFFCVYGLSFKIIRPVRETLMRERQFISNASHELKTPISVISANADVLKSIDDNKWIENIRSQTVRMESLVTDLLTLAKLDEGAFKLEKTKFNLSDAVLSAALPFDAVAFENGKRLVFDVPENVYAEGDAQSVKKILDVLMDNAVKYSSKNSEITVSLKNDGKPTLSVFNYGSDVPENEADKMFDRFYRADNSRARITGGSGLGLAIAKNIAAANKWKLYSKSVYGVSMTITLVL